MKWYELDEGERIKQVFSKYSIADFWDWWSDKQEIFMEVRIKNWELIKEVATKYSLPFSSSGIYVCNQNQLKTVIASVRDKATVWFGINPKKKNYNKRGWKSFGGGDYFVDSINYLFVDIDRFTKSKTATKEELKNCDILADKILERLEKQEWNKSYIKVASGNGIQLLIKLDVPIKLPNVIFDNSTKLYQINDEFELIKSLIKSGIGRQIARFCKKFRDVLKVEVDTSVFYIGKVGALPVTKNYKYDGFTWRGIIDMKDEENTGLSDYILSAVDDKDKFKRQNVFTSSNLTRDNILRPGKLRQNKLVKLMLDYNLPYGQINNKIWYSLKILLRDSKFNLRSDEFRELHKELESKFKGDLTLNLPHQRFKFNCTVVNNFCIVYGLPLIYELWPTKTKKLDMRLDIEWGMQELVSVSTNLNSDTNIFEDMKEVKDRLVEGNYLNANIVAGFINGCLKKYGEEKSKYYVDNVFDKFFNYE